MLYILFNILFNEYILLFAVSGCDSTSAFYGKGKAKSFQVMKKRPEFLQAFGQLGSSFHLQEDTFKWLRRFVCHLYGYDGVDDVNATRYPIFKKGKFSEELLPPTEDVLLLHIRRSNYQAYIWRHSMENFLDMPDPRIHGWVFDTPNDALEVKWMSLLLAPDSILCFINCSCAKG